MVARDADQRPGFEGTQCAVLTAAVSELVGQGFQMGRVHCDEFQVAFAMADRVMGRYDRVDILLPVIVGPPGYSACSY
jgi:hypothetical protein